MYLRCSHSPGTEVSQFQDSLAPQNACEAGSAPAAVHWHSPEPKLTGGWRCPLWEQGGIKVPDFKIEIQKTSVQLPATVNHLLSRHISHFLWVSWVPQSSCITDQQLGARSKGLSREWGWLSPVSKLGPVLPDQTLLRRPNTTSTEHFFWCRILGLHCVLWPALGGTGVSRLVQSSAQWLLTTVQVRTCDIKISQAVFFQGKFKGGFSPNKSIHKLLLSPESLRVTWSPLRADMDKPTGRNPLCWLCLLGTKHTWLQGAWHKTEQAEWKSTFRK